MNALKWAFKIFAISIVLLWLFGLFISLGKEHPSNDLKREENSKSVTPKYPTELRDLLAAKSESYEPSAVVAELFNFGSDGTDLQRQEALKNLKGKTVEWELTVYEISEITAGKYRVFTSGEIDLKDLGDKYKIVNKEPSTKILLTTLSDDEKMEMLSFKTGSKICFKGVLTGDAYLRSLEITPAVLCSALK